MAAFNWIEAEHLCPACKTKAIIHVQCHIASSFDGDNNSRFCMRSYRVGEPMAWWPETDPRHATWAENSVINYPTSDIAAECCYSTCMMCKAKLYTVVQFRGLTAVEVTEVGLEQAWPRHFPR